MSESICSVDGCGGASLSRGWCQAHYFRWRRHGDPGVPEIQVKGAFVACHIDGCESKRQSLGLCSMHLHRYRKWGDPYYSEDPARRGPANASWKNDDIGYGTAHERVRGQRGKASGYECCNCGGQAKHWAYDHDDPDERTSSMGAYSVSPEHYLPMCVPCHKRFDLVRIG